MTVRPELSCGEWHGDGTAGENDRGDRLWRRYQLQRWAGPVQGDTILVGKLTVGRVKCQVGQGGMTSRLEGSAVCWSFGGAGGWSGRQAQR